MFKYLCYLVFKFIISQCIISYLLPCFFWFGRFSLSYLPSCLASSCILWCLSHSCPEVATTLISNGCSYPGLGGDRDQLIAFEVALLRLQMMVRLFLHSHVAVSHVTLSIGFDVLIA